MASDGELWECALVVETISKNRTPGVVLSADESVIRSVLRSRPPCPCGNCAELWIFSPDGHSFDGRLVWPCQVELRNAVDQLGKLA